MILTYSYDTAKHVIDLFNTNKIVTLTVAKSISDKYVFDFTTIDDYDNLTKDKIGAQYLDIITLNTRVTTVELLKEFANSLDLNGVDLFELKFDLLNNTCKYKKSFKDSSINLSSRFQNLIEQLETLGTEMDILDLQVTGIEKKVPGTGKKSKYDIATIKDIINALKGSAINE